MRGQIPTSKKKLPKSMGTSSRPGAPESKAASGEGAVDMTMAALSIVNYAYSEFKGDKLIFDLLGAEILSQYQRFGAKGQGSAFPLFTEHYLGQDTRSKIPGELIRWIQACSQSFLERQAPSLIVNVTPETIYPLWGNVNMTGQYHTPHNHGLGEFVLSGVFFVSAPSDLKIESEGLLVLERTSLPGIEGRFDLVYRPSDKIQIRPVPGWMILFPPFVRHYVTPHASAQPRISVAFNIGNAAILGVKPGQGL